MQGDYLVAGYYTAIYVGLAISFFLRQIRYEYRASMLLLVLSLVSLSELYTFGLSSLGPPLLFGAVLFASLLLGRRAGYVFLALALGVVGLFSWLYVGGIIEIVEEEQMGSLDPFSWFVLAIGIAFLGLGALLSTTMIIRRLNEIAQQSVEALAQRDAELLRSQAIEARLREREERYDSFLHSTTDAVWCLELRPPLSVKAPTDEQVEAIFNAVLVECNDVLAQAYRLPNAKALVGRQLSELVDSPSHTLHHLIRRFVESGYISKNEEAKLQSDEGHMRHFAIGGTGVLEDGYLKHIWGSQREITLLRQVEGERRLAEERYSNLVHNIPGAVYLAHRNAQELRIQFVSDAFEHLSGVTPANALGMSSAELNHLFHPEDRDMVTRGIDAACATNGEYVIEYRILRPDGSHCWVLDRGRARAHEHGIGHWLEGVMFDISKRKEAESKVRLQEEQLRQSQKMEAIGQLAGGIAHDFNNVLQGILGFADLALHTEGIPPRVERSVTNILHSAERAAALVRQLLTFSRRMEAQPVYVDLGLELQRTAELLKRVLGEHIALSIELGSERHCVFCDPSQVEQLILNLAINARDAMPEGGRLGIKLDKLTLNAADASVLGLEQPGAYVRLQISDTGHGIDEKTMPHIFEPFFTTKDFGKGTGLGLATVYGIVKRYAGSIDVRSEVHVGTQFTILFPREDAAPSTMEPAHGAPQLVERSLRTILLAEDDDAVREATREVLERGGYTVMTARNGLEAVRLFERDGAEISLAILDVIMPEMGGAAALAALRARNPQLPVIFVTGYSYNLLPEDLSQQDVLLLQKPVRAQDLLARVRQLLQPVALN